MSNIILPSNDIEIANPSGNLLPSQFNASFLGNLKPILEDVLAGDPKAATRPEFTCLNLSAVQKALDWLQNNDMLSKTAKADLIMNPWRLNYKDRPPTPEEFLTKKFIGPQAEGMYEHNRKAFIEFMDPLKPYDCLILYSCIGSGKDQPISSLVAVEASKSSSKSLKYKRLKDIQIGDKIYTPSNDYAKVVNIQKNGVKPTYKIVLSNGKSFRCSYTHYNTVCFRTENGEKVWDTVTTEYIKNNLNKYLFEFPTLETFTYNLSLSQHLKSLACHEGAPANNIIPITVKDDSKVYIKEIIPSAEEECWCIQLNDPNGLYYTDNGAITHNSTLTMLVFLYLATLFAYMRAPFRYFGHQPSTQYVFALCSMTMKKASELYMEPIRNIIENADFWQKCRTKYDMIAEEKKFEEQGTVDHINWTTASPTSPLATSNGLNWKIISSEGGLIGQSQPLDEPIKMADGTWKNMGDIEIGDKVMSSKGTPTYVMAILPQGKIPCYTITLDDGRSVRCSANHKWKVAWEKLPNDEWNWQIVNTQFMIDHPDLDFEIWDYYNTICINNKKEDKKIKSIEYCGDEIQQCIQVSAEDHLYITKDNITTSNCICAGALSEAGFWIENGWTEDQVMTFFNKLRKRIDSRMNQDYFGKFVIDSSPASLESPIDQWIAGPAAKSPKVYRVTGSSWDLFPDRYNASFWDKDHNEVHNMDVGIPIFKGANGKPPLIVPNEGALALYDPNDIIWAPKYYMGNYQYDRIDENIIEFMKDWAGIPAGQQDRIFYDLTKVEDAFDNTLKNMYTGITAPAEENPEHLIWNQVRDQFFNKLLDKYYFYYQPDLPRVLSVDQSLTGDATSIAFSHYERDPEKIDPTTGEMLNCVVTDLVIVIFPKGGIINLDAIKYFIMDLVTLGNINIRHVSFDGYQSEPTRQFLKRQGITVDYISVDKNNNAYFTFIDLVNKHRWHCGKNIFTKNNMKALHMTKRKETGTSKVDHMNGPLVHEGNTEWNTSTIGQNSKDSTDAIAANCELLSLYSTDFPATVSWNAYSIKENSYDEDKSKYMEAMKAMGLGF